MYATAYTVVFPTRPTRWLTVTCFLVLYVDGREVASRNGIYPKPSPPPTSYHLGSDPFVESSEDDMDLRWSMASCHVIAVPLPTDIVLLTHRIGPRYHGNFQDGSLFRFLTYQMYTSVNVHVFARQSHSTQGQGAKDTASLVSRGLAGDMGFIEEQVMLSLNPGGVTDDPNQPKYSGIRVVQNTGQWNNLGTTFARISGDFAISRAYSFDIALWRAGGPAVPLELIRFSMACGHSPLTCRAKTDSPQDPRRLIKFSHHISRHHSNQLAEFK